MSFKPLSKPTPQDTDALPSFLEQAKPLSADPALADRDAGEARKSALRVLNAIKIISPILGAVAEKGGTGQETAENFKALVGHASAFAERMCARIGIDPAAADNHWVRNSFERIAAEALRDGWHKHGLQYLAGVESALSVQLPELEKSESNDSAPTSLPPMLQVRVAVMKAMAPVMSASQNGFDFFRKDPAADLEEVGSFLYEGLTAGTSQLASEKVCPRDRAAIFAILAGEAGSLFAQSWKIVGKQTVDKLSKLSNKELNALLAENPQGLSLDPVKEHFSKNFERLVGFSGKLSCDGPGKIKDRIAKKRTP